MNQDTFNMEVRKFLKVVGVTSQREIEAAVDRAIQSGRIKGGETFPPKSSSPSMASISSTRSRAKSTWNSKGITGLHRHIRPAKPGASPLSADHQPTKPSATGLTTSMWSTTSRTPATFRAPTSSA